MSNYLKQDPNYQVSEVKRIKDMFETGRLGRREFLQGLIATGLTVSTAAAVITGSRDVKAETPKRGGLVRMANAQHGPDDTLDPLLWKDTLGYTRGRVHYNGLVQFNEGPDRAPRAGQIMGSQCRRHGVHFRARKRCDLS